VKILWCEAGTGARVWHSFLWRSYSHRIHGAHSNSTICVAAMRPIPVGGTALAPLVSA
jgi:hypothetical protein